MSGPRTSRRAMEGLKRRLDERGLAVLRQVAQLRLMTGRQIAAVHFPVSAHTGSLGAAQRAARRTLAWMISERLLVRTGRQVGGVRAGSTGFVFAIGPVGERLLALDGPRRRYREPSAQFLGHTLAVSQLVVDLTLAARDGRCEILGMEAEPESWRPLPGIGDNLSLRPDLFVSLGVGDYERRWFVEVDRGQEHLPTLLRKCHRYESYYRSGVEQAEHGVFPRVCWLMPHNTRAKRLEAEIEVDGRLTDELFVVLTEPEAINGLLGVDR